jgi:hypothetical protein
MLHTQSLGQAATSALEGSCRQVGIESDSR